MKIIISPAKRMNTECIFPMAMSTPIYLEKAMKLQQYLASLSYDDLKRLLVCNDEIAQLNYERYQTMDFQQNTCPALLAYDGIQYKYMAPHIFEDAYFEYVNQHVRILSGLYGILKPFDGVVAYRLEMQAKLKTSFCKNLYDYWQDDIYQALTNGEQEILNLASGEYSKAVKKYIHPTTRFVTCVFGEKINGLVKEKGIYVKMARGEMVRYMAEHAIQHLDDIKSFNRLGFQFEEALSNENTFVYIKESKKE